MKRFILGLLGGVATGAVTRLILSDTSDDGNGGTTTGPAARARALTDKLPAPARAKVDQVREAFSQGRASALKADGRGRPLPPEGVTIAVKPGGGDGTETAVVTRQQSVSTKSGGETAVWVRSVQDDLKDRWKAAVAEGKKAATESETELRRKYLHDTKRV